MVGVAIGVAGVASAGASVLGASEQASATQDASDSQMAMYNQTRADLLPYNTAGQSATTQLSNRLADLTSPIAPIVMDQATLEKTPGYQFNLQQGLKSTQNSAAARGLGTSGAALKGAASYATGLADSTYQNQFNNALSNATLQQQNQTNAYNKLLGVSQLGESAASQTGAYGTQTGQSIGANTIAGGTAQAAGLNGAANALGNSTNSYLNYNALQKGMYSSGYQGS